MAFEKQHQRKIFLAFVNINFLLLAAFEVTPKRVKNWRLVVEIVEVISLVVLFRRQQEIMDLF